MMLQKESKEEEGKKEENKQARKPFLR